MKYKKIYYDQHRTLTSESSKWHQDGSFKIKYIIGSNTDMGKSSPTSLYYMVSVDIGHNCIINRRFIKCNMDIGHNCIFYEPMKLNSRSHIGSNCTFNCSIQSNMACSFGNSCSINHRSKLGKQNIFGSECSFGPGCSFGEYTIFGDGCTFNHGCTFSKGIKFGDNCKLNKCRFNSPSIVFGKNCIVKDCTLQSDTIDDNGIVSINVEPYIVYTYMLSENKIIGFGISEGTHSTWGKDAAIGYLNNEISNLLTSENNDITVNLIY